MSSIEEQASAITKKVQAHFDRIKAEAYQRGYEDAMHEQRKPTHKTPTEDDVGRLVMVRDSEAQHWRGPYVLKDVSAAGYRTSQHMPYGQAKLYTGPTRPNWIEHDGRGVPDEVKEAGQALIQSRCGNIRLVSWKSDFWFQISEKSKHDIMRYTIINP